MYKNDEGDVKRFSLGTSPDTSLKDARKLASEVMSRVHEGDDPMRDKQIRRAAPKMFDLWEAYQESLSRKTKENLFNNL